LVFEASADHGESSIASWQGDLDDGIFTTDLASFPISQPTPFAKQLNS